MKLFLGFSFRDEDSEIVELVDQLIASHLVEMKTGERMAGGQLTSAVQRAIEDCDALVGILTRRDKKQDGQWTTHQWVQDEINWARAKNRKVIALVEQGVEIGGMFKSHEHIPLDKANPIQALLTLSDTIGLWRRELGRTVKVQIMPDAIARKVGGGSNGLRCRHRLWLGGAYSPWQDLTPVPEKGGTFVFINGVQDEHLIQLHVEHARKFWKSVATSQWIQVTLKSGGTGE
jgi:hypothetical protein